jgi:hypothetical protein
VQRARPAARQHRRQLLRVAALRRGARAAQEVQLLQTLVVRRALVVAVAAAPHVRRARRGERGRAERQGRVRRRRRVRCRCAQLAPARAAQRARSDARALVNTAQRDSEGKGGRVCE